MAALAAAPRAAESRSCRRSTVAAARLARVHGWHTSPHIGSGAPRTAASTPRLDRLEAMPRLARLAMAGGGGMPCQAVHASHGGGVTSTERADLSDYDPTHIFMIRSGTEVRARRLYKGRLVQVGNSIELDNVVRQFEPSLRRPCGVTLDLCPEQSW